MPRPPGGGYTEFTGHVACNVSPPAIVSFNRTFPSLRYSESVSQLVALLCCPLLEPSTITLVCNWFF